MVINLENLSSNYKFEKKLGSGGMGDVYLALDKRLDRYVAIKILKFLNIEGNIEDFISRFKVEAKSIARLNHTNIVGIYDIGSENNSHYMIMEYLDGNNLHSIIKSVKQKIPINLISSIAFQIASGLEYAHENNIIHRDIKPENVILSKKGVVKITDFGIAKFGKDNFKLMDEASTIVGSILYSSPEQLKNSAQVDFRTDIYSLGATLYELVTGAPPFYNSKDTSETITRIFTEHPEDIKKSYNNIPHEFSNIILKCLEKSPQKRFQSATELKTALIPFLQGEELTDISSSNLLDISQKAFEENKNTSLSKTYIKQSFVLKNKLIDSNITKNTSIFDTSIEHITQANNNIKKYDWIKELLSECKIKKLTLSDSKNLLDDLIQKSSIGQNFTGLAIIDDFFFIFVYDGNLIGSLVDLDSKKIIGDKAIEYLPESYEKAEIISASDKYLQYPILIYNIVSSGLEVYSDLNKTNTDLDFLFDRIMSEDENFTGIVECKVVESASNYKILHIEDDDVSRIVISNSLKKLPFQIQYFSADSIESASILIENNKYDFIILDLFLKDGDVLNDFLLKDGATINLIEKLKASQDVPILITTSSQDPNIAVTVMKRGNNENADEQHTLQNYVIDYKIKSPDTSYFNEINQVIESFFKNKTTNVNSSDLIFYLAFANSKNIFNIQTDIEKNTISIINQSIKDIKNDYEFNVNIYKYKIDFLDFNMHHTLNTISFKKMYKNSINIILKNILERAELIPEETQKALEENIELSIPKDLKVKVLDSTFDLEKKISVSKYYNFSLWLLKKLFYKINHLSNKESFATMYDNIHNIDHINFFTTLSGTDNKMHKFHCVFKNKEDKILFLARFGNSNSSKIEEFIKETTQIKKLNKEIKGAFYISSEDYYPSDLDIIKKYTKSSSFSFFDKLAKYNSIVRVDDSFFHINLIYYDKSIKDFDVIYPVI